MNTLVVYFSKFGNTRKLAEAMAEMLRAKDSVHLVSIEQLTLPELSSADLIVMGCPTHKMNLPDAVKQVFETLPRHTLNHVPIATFDTSYKLSWWLNYFTAAKRLAGKLRQLGGKQVILPETFLVEGREGPLQAGELQRAKLWAATLQRRAELLRALP